MTSTTERYGWGIAFALLVAFAVPWFMWGDSRMAYGLPLWLWWHVGWMALASAAFWLFATRAWGLGIVADAPGGGDPPEPDGRQGTGDDDAGTAGRGGGRP